MRRMKQRYPLAYSTLEMQLRLWINGQGQIYFKCVLLLGARIAFAVADGGFVLNTMIVYVVENTTTVSIYQYYLELM